MFYLILAVLAGYVIGSIPTGYLIVRIVTGQDIRGHESGRTGGTNVGRVVGTWGFVLTAILDGVKALVAVLIVRALLRTMVSGTISPWPEVLAGIAAVVGHNWSVFLGFKGGAGTSPCVGAAAALWGWSVVIAALCGTVALLIWSMASVGSLVAIVSLVIMFCVRALLGMGPWEHVIYGIVSALLVIWSLRPNIQRLRAGTERRVWFGLNKAERKE